MGGLNFYDLQPLALANDHYEFTQGLKKVVVSFCNDLTENVLTTNGCDSKLETMAILTDGVTCVSLSGKDPTKNADFEVGNEDDDDGLAINYSGGQEGYDLTVNLICDKDTTFSDNTLDALANDNIKASFHSKTGCKNGQLSAIWTWFQNNKWAMFAFFLIVGTTICFFGRSLFKPVLFLTGIIMATFFINLLFYSTFLKSNTKAWVGWVVLGSSILIGLLIGWLFVKVVRLGAFCLAAWGGFSVGLLLYNAFMYKMDSDAGFWCFTIGVALVFGVLALCFFDHILIHATAIFGSFMAVYGIGLVAGRYTNPFTIVEMIKHGQIEHIDPVFYAYMAGNLVMYILGMLFQYRQKNANPDHNPYHGMQKVNYSRGRYY